VMDEGLCAGARALIERLLQGIQREIAPQRTGHARAHDPAGEDVDHERDEAVWQSGR